MDGGEGAGTVALGYSKKDTAVLILGTPEESSDASTRILNASNIRKARDLLSSRGVNVGVIEQDRQGTHYFEFRDCEENAIEVSEEPCPGQARREVAAHNFWTRPACCVQMWPGQHGHRRTGPRSVEGNSGARLL
jgi:hypothetical protein